MHISHLFVLVLIAGLLGLMQAQVPSPMDTPIYPKNPDPLPYSWWNQWWWLALIIMFGIEIICLIILGYLILCHRRRPGMYGLESGEPDDPLGYYAHNSPIYERASLEVEKAPQAAPLLFGKPAPRPPGSPRAKQSPRSTSVRKD